MKYNEEIRKDGSGDILHEALGDHQLYKMPATLKPNFSVEPVNDKDYDIEFMTGKNSGKGSGKNRRV